MTNNVLVFFGTRPEVIKLWPLILLLQKQLAPRLKIINTGQQGKECSQMIHEFLHTYDVMPNINHAHDPERSYLPHYLINIARLAIARWKPQIVIVHGDTTTAFASTLAAFYSEVPIIAHVEAGLTTYDMVAPFPEEMHRRCIDSLATHVYYPTEMEATAHSVCFKRQGQKGLVVGNTVIDAVMLARDKIKQGHECASLPGNPKGTNILLTWHRRENTDNQQACEALVMAIKRLQQLFYCNITIIEHFRNAGLRRRLTPSDGIFCSPPVSHLQMVKWLEDADVLITDSGGLQEEASILGTPIVVVRKQTERSALLTERKGALVDPTNSNDIVEAVVNALMDDRPQPSTIFGDGNAAKRIMSHLMEDLA